MADRELGNSEKQNALKIKMPEEQYLKHITDRIIEIEKLNKDDFKRELSKKEYNFTSKTPVLVVGRGVSYKNHIKEITEFPGETIFIDMVFHDFTKNYKFASNYVMTLEAHIYHQTYKSWTYYYRSYYKNKPTWVCSSWTQERVKTFIKSSKLDVIDYIDEDEPRISNVGLFAVVYAFKQLKADKIFLIGMEHAGNDNDQDIFDWWIVDFYHFVRKMPKNTIVNCTDGGALYGHNIIDSDLKTLVIN